MLNYNKTENYVKEQHSNYCSFDVKVEVRNIKKNILSLPCNRQNKFLPRDEERLGE